MSGMRDAALAYAKIGWRVLPCKPRSKEPACTHGQHDAITDEAQIRAWWPEGSECNIGVACKASGIVVIDVDVPHADHPADGRPAFEALKAKLGPLPETVEAQTPTGGKHFLFVAPDGVNFVGRPAEGIDIRHNAYIVAEPSVHPEGGEYRWVRSPFDHAVAALPAAWLESLRKRAERATRAAAPAGDEAKTETTEATPYGLAALDAELNRVRTAPAGERNNTLNEAALKLGRLHAGAEVGDVRSDLIVCGIEAGLDEDETRKTVESGWSAGLKQPRSAPQDTDAKNKTPQSRRLIDLAHQNSELFRTADGDPYAFVDGRKTLPVRSTEYRRDLVRWYYERYGRTPSTTGLGEAIDVLDVQARNCDDVRAVSIRVAEYTGPDGVHIVVDLGDKTGNVVDIGPNRVNVAAAATAPVRFRRSATMLPLPRPEAGGTVDDLRPYLNCRDDEQFRLLVSWLLSTFRARGPFPILALGGEQGAAKSTTARALRLLIDPSKMPLRLAPRDDDSAMIALRGSHVVAYDNLSTMAQWLSDLLCVVATGGGYSKRELYSDVGEVIVDVCKPVIVNGIADLVTRPDLASRAVVLSLPAVPDRRRRDEREFWTEFRAQHARIFGTLCEIVSKILAILPTIKLTSMPRMADVAIWCTAAEKALGWPDGSFLAAFESSQEDAAAASLDADLVGSAVLALMHSQAEWSGTAAELLGLLTARLDPGKAYDRAWPRTPAILADRLRRCVPVLRGLGLHADQGRAHGGVRIWTLTWARGDDGDGAVTTPKGGIVTAKSQGKRAVPAKGDDGDDSIPSLATEKRGEREGRREESRKAAQWLVTVVTQAKITRNGAVFCGDEGIVTLATVVTGVVTREGSADQVRPRPERLVMASSVLSSGVARSGSPTVNARSPMAGGAQTETKDSQVAPHL